MHGPNPYKFTGIGDMHGPKPYEFIRFGDMLGPKPYKFIGFGAMDVTTEPSSAIALRTKSS